MKFSTILSLAISASAASAAPHTGLADRVRARNAARAAGTHNSSTHWQRIRCYFLAGRRIAEVDHLVQGKLDVDDQQGR